MFDSSNAAGHVDEAHVEIIMEIELLIEVRLSSEIF